MASHSADLTRMALQKARHLVDWIMMDGLLKGVSLGCPDANLHLACLIETACSVVLRSVALTMTVFQMTQNLAFLIVMLD